MENKKFTFYKMDANILNKYGFVIAGIYGIILNGSQNGYKFTLSPLEIGNIGHMNYSAVAKHLDEMVELGLIARSETPTAYGTYEYWCVEGTMDLGVDPETMVILKSNKARRTQRNERLATYKKSVTNHHKSCDETSQTCDETSQSCDDSYQTCDETSQNCDETYPDKELKNLKNNKEKKEEIFSFSFFQTRMLEEFDVQVSTDKRWKDIHQFLNENIQWLDDIIYFFKQSTGYRVEFLTLDKVIDALKYIKRNSESWDVQPLPARVEKEVASIEVARQYLGRRNKQPEYATSEELEMLEKGETK